MSSRKGIQSPEEVAQFLPSMASFREYQLQAIKRVVFRTLKSRTRLLLTLPTGAGKSWIIAGIASALKNITAKRDQSHKKILVLAPSGEIVEQNHEKMVQSGFKADIFSSNLGYKNSDEDIIYGTPRSVLGSIDTFTQYDFAAVFIDEAHSHPPTIQTIIETLKGVNPNLRVIGLTATPYKLNYGYIYYQDIYRNLEPLSEQFAREPYFDELVYEITPQELIEEGFLVPPVIGDVAEQYQTQRLRRNSEGGWTNDSSRKVFEDKAKGLAKRIVRDIKEKSKDRHGVMIFAAHVRHGEMVLELLPKTQSAIITGDTPRAKRREIIRKFKERKLKYLVNVRALARGFDATHVDVVALMMATESAALLQQIIGRGLRPDPHTGKVDCLVLDYAGNIGRFAPDGDVFAPRIRAAKTKDPADVETLEVTCPQCSGINYFKAADPIPGTEIDENGFVCNPETMEPLLSASGEVIVGHLGSQCTHYVADKDQGVKRCSFMWRSKTCPVCATVNPITAGQCFNCRTTIGGSALKLETHAEVNREGYYGVRTAEVQSISFKLAVSRTQRRNLRVDFQVRELPFVSHGEDGQWHVTHPDPQTVSVWVGPEIPHPSAQRAWQMFVGHCVEHNEGDEVSVDRILKRELAVHKPAYITFRQKPPQGEEQAVTFYDVTGYYDRFPYGEAQADEQVEKQT